MRKFYVLDTSVLAYDPLAFREFRDNDVVIPITVLDELDKLKTFSNSAGKNARIFIRLFDELLNNQDVTKPIKLLEQNINLRIDARQHDITMGDDKNYGDNKILACAKAHVRVMKKTGLPREVVLVTRDINLRIRARTMGLGAEHYEKDRLGRHDLYTGMQTIEHLDDGVTLNETGMLNLEGKSYDIYPNECVNFVDESGGGLAIGRRIGDRLRVIQGQSPFGLQAKNREQAYAINMLLDPKLPLVSLIGKAGSGKSLVALACGLENVIERRKFDKMVIFRPMQAVGGDVGFLPGPQPLDAKIATPDGWTTMGKLAVGSTVIARDGAPTKVLGIYPKGQKDVYKVTTSDGTSTECCIDHLWYTETFEDKKRGRVGSVKTTQEIINSLNTKNGKINHFLPRNEAVQYSAKDLPIAPYLLGVILGDGSISDSVGIVNTDRELIDRCNNEVSKCGCNLTNNGEDIIFNIRSELYNNKPARPVRITNLVTGSFVDYHSVGHAHKETGTHRGTIGNRCTHNRVIDGFKYEFLPCPVRWQNPIKNFLHNLGLTGTYAWTKFIPEMYLTSSIEDRLELLRGLMDTDGTVKKTGEASYTTTSSKLADGVIELVRSLGGRATKCSRNRVGKNTKIDGRTVTTRRVSYEFTISLPEKYNPFYISRKAKNYKQAYIHRVGIVSIEKVSKKEVQCIMVDNPEHLYLTDNFIVTHNTLEEKIGPWMGAIRDSLELLLRPRTNQKERWDALLGQYMEKGKVEFNPLTYIRGRSISNAFILVDEAQNISKEDMKAILTRAGHGTKIVLTGDIEQIDATHLDALNNGLTYAVEKFKTSELSGHVTFLKGERSPLATEASELL